jgi:hypothetical protein
LKPDHEYAITQEKLASLLGSKDEQETTYRLAGVHELGYLKTEPYAAGDEYALSFATRAGELGGEPKQPHRQITVDSVHVDLRNRANFDLANADIKDIETVAYGWLHEFRTATNKRVKRAAELQLQRVILLKGRKISRALYETIDLRLRGQLDAVPDDAVSDTPTGGPMLQVRVSHEPWN